MVSHEITKTLTCTATYNTCGNFTKEDPCDCTIDKPKTCLTHTTDLSETFCQTVIQDDKCIPTYGCKTKNCVSQWCADSNSRADLCCPLTEEDDCVDTVNYCATNYNCGDSIDLCQTTKDIQDYTCTGVSLDGQCATRSIECMTSDYQTCICQPAESVLC